MGRAERRKLERLEAKKSAAKSRQYRSKEEICVDFGKDGIPKFHRIGIQKAWQEFMILFDHVLIFSMNIGPERINYFHAMIDYWWYKYDNGEITYEDLMAEAKDKCEMAISWSPLDEKDVKKLAGKDKYLQYVGKVNTEMNNQILKLHAVHECCAVLALHDMGWQNKTIHKFDNCLLRRLDECYVKNGTKYKDYMIAVYKKELQDKYNYEFEEIVDPLYVTG